MIKHVRSTFVLAALLTFTFPAVGFAQDPVARVKGLYESADYEEALQLLETLKGKPTNSEAAAYRVFCLVALGRRDEAKAAVESLVRTDPLYRPSDGQVSPRLRTFFDDARKPLLPEIARQSYTTAKAAFDQKSWQTAVTEFDRVISLLTEIGPADAGASDLRTLASGFRDLAKAAIEPPKAPAPPPPAPTPTPTPTPAAPPKPSVYGVENTDVKRPVAVSKILPEWHPMNPAEERMSFVGAVEVLIGEDGKVQNARLIDSVHPRYDPELLKAAARWTFHAATKDGVAVKYRYTVAVQLGK